MIYVHQIPNSTSNRQYSKPNKIPFKSCNKLKAKTKEERQSQCQPSYHLLHAPHRRHCSALHLGSINSNQRYGPIIINSLNRSLTSNKVAFSLIIFIFFLLFSDCDDNNSCRVLRVTVLTSTSFRVPRVLQFKISLKFIHF